MAWHLISGRVQNHRRALLFGVRGGEQKRVVGLDSRLFRPMSYSAPAPDGPLFKAFEQLSVGCAVVLHHWHFSDWRGGKRDQIEEASTSYC